MQFLCLHGAIGNIDNISIQLAPLEKELQNDNAATFHYIQGPIEIDPPPGFKDYFGIGPHYRWMDDGGTAEDTMLSRIRELPAGQTPEDVMRALAKKGGSWNNRQGALDYLYDVLDQFPEIQGIVGYSEGAAMAGTLILDEETRFRNSGRPRRIRCALFFTGWPPVSPDHKIVLCDESELMIDIPTLHVVGANDPYRHGALALYNVCDPDTAKIFDTGKGHTIPRGGLVITELGNAVREMIYEASQVDNH